MKYLIQYASGILLGITLLASCKKSGELVTIGDPAAGTLQSTTTAIIPDSTKPNDMAVTLSWGSISFGDDIITTNVLQVDASGLGTFVDSNTIDLQSGDETSFEWTNNKINRFWIDNGAVPKVAYTMSFRVKYAVNIQNGTPSTVTPRYSNVVNLTVTPFDMTPPPAPKLYVAGDYQGWSPSTAPTIESPNSNGIFSGIIEILKPGGPGSNEFKFTSIPAWSGTNYGAGATAGTLSTDGGAGNLKVPSEGTYLLTANINLLTWSYAAENWGVIGSACLGAGPSSWSSDTNMIYNYTSKLYEITMNMQPGQFKFRKNDGWTINYGSTGANDGDVKPLNGDATDCSDGGKNFGIAVAGNYTLKLNPVTKKCYVTKN